VNFVATLHSIENRSKSRYRELSFETGAVERKGGLKENFEGGATIVEEATPSFTLAREGKAVLAPHA
jgi:hypothetical protein